MICKKEAISAYEAEEIAQKPLKESIDLFTEITIKVIGFTVFQLPY